MTSTSVSLGNIKYSLQNSDNYKNSISHDIHQIIEKYTMLIIEYLKFIIENTNIKNKSYFKYILIRGIETISHVFNTLLYYTKNLDVSYYNSQKALYFYVEFICQIFDTQNTYLKLSSRDAVMYVYKKTLFDLNHDKKKTAFGLVDEDKEKHDILSLYNKLYKNMVFYILNYNEFLLQNKKETIQHIIHLFEATCDKIVSYQQTDPQKISALFDFTQLIHSFSIDIRSYLNLVLLFTKKNHKKFANKTKTSLGAEYLETILEQYESQEEFIEWFFT